MWQNQNQQVQILEELASNLYMENHHMNFQMSKLD